MGNESIFRETAAILGKTPEEVWMILLAYAGEIISEKNDEKLSKLVDALSYAVLTEARNHEIAHSVLAMVSDWKLQQKAMW